ncbi:hypothetical protein [Planctobacterium marinum]|uniref:hypothetical protein n=1 Tax=Planctobacterium marinum TaxID=1631968 RepID=UPI001E5F5867|nr:hypothetical protein [Planctobacterium marinum]MCC2606017.1 hypothetical protein [Planctobacterium marinum]
MKKLILSFICALFCLKAIASDSLVPLDIYGALPNVSMMEVSPSGKLIGYRMAKENREMYIIHDLENNKMLRGVDISRIRPSHAWFVDDDTLILVAVDNPVSLVFAADTISVLPIHLKSLKTGYARYWC